MADDLFSHAGDEALKDEAPLAEQLRPERLADVLGQEQLVGDEGLLTRLSRAATLPSVILWGPPGSGKTTIARLICAERSETLVPMSAVSATVKDVRAEIDHARARRSTQDRRTVVFLDEIHRFTRTQQDALLPAVEQGIISLIGATTESPWATLVGPLISRCTVVQIEPIGDEYLVQLAARAAEHTGVVIDDDARDTLVSAVDGDARKFLVAFEVAAALGPRGISADVMREALASGDLRYGTNAHYDAASAFIKWMRHSRPEQALAWLRHMLDGGEDPRFIARRMVIFASEDVGQADPRALLVADAAARAVEHVGLPEAAYNLAQAATYLAEAPKSRATVEALAQAGSTERELPPEMMGE